MPRHPPARIFELAPRPGGLALIASLLVLGAAIAAAAATAANDATSELPRSRMDFHFVEPRLSFGIRAGWAQNNASGEIYDFLTELLTLDESDFNGPAFAFDTSIRITRWLDALIGLEVSGSTADSEYRDYVDQSDRPIEQTTKLIQVPLTLSLKLYPIPRGREIGRFAWVRSRFVPYIGGGIGGTWYKLEQEGDFVDFQTLEIFEASFESKGWAVSGHAFLGLDVKLSRAFGLVVEGRYHFAEATLGGSFLGFDPIRLGGLRVMAGVSITP